MKENEVINQKNLDLETKNQLLEDKIIEVKEKNIKLKLANSLSGSSETNKETTLKINELVREIDNCIKLLTKQ